MSYLHFSVPDVGPLTDYESWMPNFIGRSGERDREEPEAGEEGCEGCGRGYGGQPEAGEYAGGPGAGGSMEAVRQMVSGLQEMFAGMQGGDGMGMISVEYFDTETLETRRTEMFVEEYKAVLVKDTSYKGMWKVSFTLKEF